MKKEIKLHVETLEGFALRRIAEAAITRQVAGTRKSGHIVDRIDR